MKMYSVPTLCTCILYLDTYTEYYKDISAFIRTASGMYCGTKVPLGSRSPEDFLCKLVTWFDAMLI